MKHNYNYVELCLCDLYQLAPQFYIVKLGLTGVYIIYFVPAINVLSILGVRNLRTFKINRIYDGVEVETRKSQASFQIIQVSSEALPRMRLE